MPEQTQKKSFILLALIYLILVHYIQYNTGGAGIDLPYNLTTQLGICIFIAWGLYTVAYSKILYISRFNISLLLFFILVSIPIFYPHSELNFFEGHYFFSIFSIICCLMILDQLQLQQIYRQNVQLLIVASSNLAAILALLQYFSLPPFDYIPLYTRPSGNLGQVNLLASYLMTGLGVALYLVNSKQPIQGKYKQAILFFAAGISPAITVLTFSRIGWVSLCWLLLITAFLYVKNPRKQLKYILLVTLISTIAATSLVSQSDTSTNMVEYKLGSAGKRADVYPLSLELLTENLVSGTGYGQFEQEIFTKSFENAQISGKDNYIHSLTHPHNEILFIAIQGGIASIAGLIILSLLIIKAIFQKSLLLSSANLLLLSPLLIHSMLELPLFASTPHLLTLFLLLYLMKPEESLLSINNNLGQYFLKPVAISILALSCAFYISGLHTLYLSYLYRANHEIQGVYKDIINPYIHQQKYQNYLAINKIFNTSYSGKNAENELLSFYSERIAKHPRPANLNNLCLVYLKFNRWQKAAETLERINLSFPGYFSTKQQSCKKLYEARKKREESKK